MSALTYEAAKSLYSGLCARAARLFKKETAESHALSAAAQALSGEWEFAQPFDLSGLRDLSPADREAFLAVLGYAASSPHSLGAFSSVYNQAFKNL